MTPSESEAFVPYTPELTSEIRRLAVAAHERFEAEVWARSKAAVVPGVARPPSYHNARHVAAVCDCVEALFGALGEGLDPFALGNDARRWAEETGEPEPDPGTLRTAFGVAFACHDLGNISASERVALTASGLDLDLARSYDSSALYGTPAVELRGAAVARALLLALGGACGRVPALSRLVSHLVLQTVFHFEKVTDEAPFWLPMQVVDMIGSYFFLSTSRLEAIAGLFAEMRAQRPGRIAVLPFLASLEARFDRLVPSPLLRRQVLEIFERNPHGWTRETVFGVPERFRATAEPVPYEEAIAVLLAAD
jgi:hypothetical protein